VAEALGLTPVKEKMFHDFNGAIKSLGAWGGDFVLVASEDPTDKIREYFLSKGLDVVYRFEDLITESPENLSTDSMKVSSSNHLIH